MKKIILITCILLLGNIVSIGQNYATDFNASDCNGLPHNLFSELDAGKVIVLAWVMPCEFCIADPLDAMVTVNSYSTSHPGRVLFYVADDFVHTPCQTMTTWVANFGMASATVFSDPAIDMNDYGSYGMPKIVVLGGSHHQVYYNKNESSQGVKGAIDKALIGENTVGISVNESSIVELNSFPNPVNNVINVSYTLDQSSAIKLEVINVLGKVIRTSGNDIETIGKHNVKFDVSTLSNGVYFISITTDSGVEIERFTVSH